MSGNNQSTSEFDDFVASGEVEVSESNLASQPEEKEDEQPKKTAKPAKTDPEPAEDTTSDENTDEGDDQDEDTSEEEDQEEDTGKKKSKPPSERIRELNKRLRESERLRLADRDLLENRIANLEKGGLQAAGDNVNQNVGTPAPDPSDADKYPLGHLDDRYIEDKLEWLAERKATERADAVLQRQQETENSQRLQQEQQVLLEKVDDLVVRGSELYDDFQESVVESGMKGEWDLSQSTFEAAHDAENGTQILYELSQDKKEASRVAKLSPYQQLKYVQERDVEISKGKSPRRIPKAGEPPKNLARGANSRTHINPATDNLDDFEKAWEADAKGRR